MSDKGIIFSAPMVRALLDGRKLQTRRLVSPSAKQKDFGCKAGMAESPGASFYDKTMTIQFEHPSGGPWTCIKSPYAIGDRLYAREAWRTWKDHDQTAPSDLQQSDPIFYEADRDNCDRHGRLRPGMHMPRWASRLWLEITDVRVERVQHISREDAIAEGITRFNPYSVDTWQWEPKGPFASWPEGALRMLWNSLHTKPGETWADNPWVVAISFDVHRGNIDA